MKITDEDIERVSNQSDASLHGELGRAIQAADADKRMLGAKPPSLKKSVEIAKAWLMEKRTNLEDAICFSEELRHLVETEPNARIKLVRVIADVLSGIYIYLPCATIAEIIVRDGVKNLCRTIWERSQVRENSGGES